MPLVKALGERNKDKVKLALVAMDIPISRQGIDTMEKIAGTLGVEVADKQAIPPASADVSGAAARIISKEANYATSYAPVSTTVQMLGALRRQGWNGWYVHNHSSDAEDTLRQLKDPKLVMSPEYAFSVEKLPIFEEIAAAAKKYDVNMPVDKLSLGWASGMVLEAALKKCGAGCTQGEAAGRIGGPECPDRRHLSRSDQLDQGRSSAAGKLRRLRLGREIAVGKAHHRVGEVQGR